MPAETTAETTSSGEVFTGKAPVTVTALVGDLSIDGKVAVQTALNELTPRMAAEGTTWSSAFQLDDGSVVRDATTAETARRVRAILVELTPLAYASGGSPVAEFEGHFRHAITKAGGEYGGLMAPPEAVKPKPTSPADGSPETPERRTDIRPEDELRVEGDAPKMGWLGWTAIIGGGALVVGGIGYLIYRKAR